MKPKIPKKLAIVLILSTQFASVSLGQKHLPFLLSQAQTLQEKSDYLIAAKIFKFVASQATDSSLIADALYGYVTCGDDAAEVFTVRYFTSTTFHNMEADSLWKKDFDQILQREFTEFTKLGIQLKFITYYEPHYVNIDTATRQVLSKDFPNTMGGQLASFDLITQEFTAAGFPIFGDPHLVLQRAFAFLDRYNKSCHKYDVYHILGRAFQDLWNCTQNEDYADILSGPEQASADDLRQKAIKYYLLAKENKDQLIRLPWGEDSDDILNRLEHKEHTLIFYFVGD